MSRPTAISPEEQEQIARKIGVLLLQGAPEDWQEITVEYRATGEYTDLLGELTAQDGSSRPLEPPVELREIFERLREGMYRPDVGTWLSALYVVERPSSYRIDINFDTEPQWQRPLPRAAYVDELRRYPRSEENIPDWMQERVDGTASQQAEDAPVVPDTVAGLEDEAAEHTGIGSGRFRITNVFDDVDDEGRPVVSDRRPVPADEVGALRQYLENAPVVLASRENEEDHLDPERAQTVPGTWHTDGTWLWPGSVAYYLAQYGMPPETALVDHVRSRGFTVGDVDDETREAAVSELVDQPGHEPVDEPESGSSGAAVAAGAGAAAVGAAAVGAAAIGSSSSASTEPEVDELDEPAALADEESAPATSGSRHVLDEDDDAPDSQEVLAKLHDRLTDFQIDSDAYRLGSRSADAHCLVQDGDDWVVTGAEDVRFARVDHAAAYLLGQLLMERPAASVPAAIPTASAPAAEAAELPQRGAEPVDDLPQRGSQESELPQRAQQDPADLPQRTPESAELPQRGAPDSDLPQRSAEPAAELPKRNPEPSSDLPQRTPQAAELPQRAAREPEQSGPSTGGNPLFTANQDAAPPQDPAPQAPQSPPTEEPTRFQPAPSMDRPLPPQAPPSPPAGNPAQPQAGGAPGSNPLPKRQPRRDSNAPVPPAAGPAQGPAGGAERRPGPGGPGMAGPQRQGPPPGPPRPQGQPPQGQPQAAPNGQPNNGQPPQGQPIQPLNGEPPLTLYRDRRIVMLQPGTELDRFGEPNGNVLYTLRTPYTHRSLPPQWANRTYAAYRVQRPIQALRGTAVAWFEQPGGGTAFVLPAAVSDLIADGTLAEMPATDRPPME
ncbi:glycohydrolase toxin TNT-related protein [Saccharopolyspora mangrovi]|uniref:Glycohydrolase toxin TNT-related protein n=1 Tax=Saccharopolyspora mangrovi TaxID=3082379 RepID=A0ABU6ABL2_9PSEU|nr:glycohydrolase toxin TNT-related protein [Saccharopolyspora sp. S2-29]MEB3368878.1 glycohydrolase toxin TNT-related protein [Saccharopolyspora sp. S2-29]